MPVDFAEVREPVADPTAKPRASRKTAAPPIADLPLDLDSVTAPPKVSPRFPYTVRVQSKGHAYGPLTINAVDEADAKLQVFESSPALKADALYAVWTIARASEDPVNLDKLSAKQIEALNAERERRKLKPLKAAGGNAP